MRAMLNVKKSARCAQGSVKLKVTR
jgi:hypothetical protein